MPLGAYRVERAGPTQLLVRAVAPREDRAFAVALARRGTRTDVHVYVLRRPEAAKRRAKDGALVCLRVRSGEPLPSGRVAPVPRQPDPLAGLTRAQLRALRTQDGGARLACRVHNARLLPEVPKAG